MINNSPFLALFVPGNRPERFNKAAYSGADAIIIDLEDAVSEDDRPVARNAIRAAMDTTNTFPCEVCIRINGSETENFRLDLGLLEDLPEYVGLMLAKTEMPEDIEYLNERFSKRFKIGLIETPKGLTSARSLATLCDRLAFGSIDYANSIGAAHLDRPLLAARSELVLASALAGRPGPIDGVTTSIKNYELVAEETSAAKELGFRGKLLIHPDQVMPSLKGMAPDEKGVNEARRMLASVASAASDFEGKMVDAPVLLAARKIIEEHDALLKRIGKLEQLNS